MHRCLDGTIAIATIMPGCARFTRAENGLPPFMQGIDRCTITDERNICFRIEPVHKQPLPVPRHTNGIGLAIQRHGPRQKPRA